MLIELRVRDFAVIDDLRLEFGPGLTVLTGETGAGKSLVVDALALLLGERASADVVRAGAERARVEAVFDARAQEPVLARLDAAGVEVEDGLVLLSREVARAGRNRAWINGSAATAGLVGEIGRQLTDLHGQHEHQTLLRRADQRRILDAYGAATGQAARVVELHSEHRRLRQRAEDRRARLGEMESRRDFLRFQLDEIHGVAPEPGEDRQIREQVERLRHVEELARESGALQDALHDGEASVADQLAAARDQVRRLSGYDSSLESHADVLDDAYHRVVDVSRELGAYADSVERDPAVLAALQERLDALERLKRKYGGTLEAVLAHADGLREELAELEDVTGDLESLEQRTREAASALESAARTLTASRTRAARRLSAAVQDVLPTLGLDGAVFQILLARTERIHGHGAEDVEFRASLNPGFDPRSLSRIASGGELSRVMLALKSILVEVDRVPTLVFDEVDAGVGGAVARAVADALRAVSEQHQVFVVTHLAQVASRADHHLVVRKDAEGAVATTRVETLDGEARVREVARMLGGDPDSERSRDHARELLAVG